MKHNFTTKRAREMKWRDLTRPVVQRPDNFIQWIRHYPTVSICAKISVFPCLQANMHTLTTGKFGSVRKQKYILESEWCLIHRIKLSGL